MEKKNTLAALASAVILAACGGGGGSSSGDSTAGGTSPGVASAEGFWVGTTSRGFDINVLALENGEFWGVYGSGGYAYGVVQGSGSWDGTTLSASGNDYYIPNASRTAGSVAATYTAKGSMTGTVTSSITSTFSATYSALYDQPASQADLTGSWNLHTQTSRGTITNPVTADASGAFSGVGPFCNYIGTITPRPTGKNVFNVSANFSRTGCQFEGKTLTGVAVLLKNGTAKTLTVAALLPDKSDGFIGTAAK